MKIYSKATETLLHSVKYTCGETLLNLTNWVNLFSKYIFLPRLTELLGLSIEVTGDRRLQPPRDTITQVIIHSLCIAQDSECLPPSSLPPYTGVLPYRLSAGCPDVSSPQPE